MAGLFADTCGDDYNTSQLARYWTSMSVAAVAPAVGAFGRFGGQGIRLPSAGGLSDGWIAISVSGLSTFVLGFAWKITGLSTGYRIVAWFTNAVGEQFEVRQYFDGSLKVFRGATEIGAIALGVAQGQFHYLEIDPVVDNSGSVALWVDNVLVLNLTATDTQNQAAADVTLARLGGDATSVAIGATGNTMDIDDVYLISKVGANPIARMGDTKMTPLFPTGAGFYTEWAPLAGANWDNVNDNPADDDTTYNIGDTVGERDTYATSDLTAPAGAVIRAVVLNIIARKDDAGVREISGKIRQGGVDANGPNLVLTTEYIRHQSWHPTDPSAGAWSVADVNSMEIGAEVEV